MAKEGGLALSYSSVLRFSISFAVYTKWARGDDGTWGEGDVIRGGLDCRNGDRRGTRRRRGRGNIEVGRGVTKRLGVSGFFGKVVCG
jgi:hypothetical protein